MTCITHHHACACREAAHADALRERDATIADLRAQVEVRDAAVREYLAVEAAVAYALADDSDALDAAANDDGGGGVAR